MLIDDFAMSREDDAPGCHRVAPPMGMGEVLSAAEPGGIVGGHPAPAPAAEPDRFGALGPGSAAMDRFLVDYLQLLDGRVEAIRRCLDDSDIEGARVAILSLESSSLMLGGRPLADRLSELRAHVDLGPTPQRNALLALVEVAASAFRRQLEPTTR